MVAATPAAQLPMACRKRMKINMSILVVMAHKSEVMM